MKFSIVIPTLNEENYIGGLLSSLVKQTFKGFEVVVIDGKSKDKTKEKVVEYQKNLDIKFIVAPKRGVGFQRNYGLKFTKYNDLIFFDADIIIEKDFLEKINQYLEKSHADVLTSWFEPLSRRKRDKIIFQVFNVYLEAIKFISPGGGGAFIYVKREPFTRVGGFSEDIVLSEDFDLVKRMDKSGFSYKLVRRPVIKVSVRRLNKEGRFHYTTNLIKAEIHSRIKGPIRDNKKIKYEFGKYD
jgi:glycosyltransferase involved in cell wall biosynthesis